MYPLSPPEFVEIVVSVESRRAQEEAEMTERTIHNKGRLQARFSLGRTVITATAIRQLSNADVLAGLGRHVCGDWGDVGKEDWQANEQALKEGTRLLSVYHTAEGVKFYVITEWDRSLTTILLPSDY